jgi:hypothetical protein
MLTASYRLEQRARVAGRYPVWTALAPAPMPGRYPLPASCHDRTFSPDCRPLSGLHLAGIPGRLHQILVEPCRRVVTSYG